MTRQPSLVSQRGERDRVITALGPDAERGTHPGAAPPGARACWPTCRRARAPADRGEVLARCWPGSSRAAPPAQRPLAEAVLAEADLLGLTAAGGLTGYTRTLLAGSTRARPSTRWPARCPTPVDHFLVQPDLTVVVPGPPEPATRRASSASLADLESTGGASVYRITERSVRRALDAGRSGDAAGRVRAPRTRAPRSRRRCSYLIDDAARRHGVLRAGAAGRTCAATTRPCSPACSPTATPTRSTCA